MDCERPMVEISPEKLYDKFPPHIRLRIELLGRKYRGRRNPDGKMAILPGYWTECCGGCYFKRSEVKYQVLGQGYFRRIIFRYICPSAVVTPDGKSTCQTDPIVYLMPNGYIYPHKHPFDSNNILCYKEPKTEIIKKFLTFIYAYYTLGQKSLYLTDKDILEKITITFPIYFARVIMG